MTDNLILLGTIVLILTIIWISINLNIRVRRQKLKEIKGHNLTTCVSFVHNFNKAEKEEKAGNNKLALILYRKALENLEKEEKKDKLVLETIAEVTERINNLENSQTDYKLNH